MSNKNHKNSVFERHPKKTLSIIIILGIIILDLVFTATLKSVGLFKPVYTTASKLEAHYRQQHPIFHHTLKPNIHWQHAEWGGQEYEVYTNSLGFKDHSVRQIHASIDRKKVQQRLLFIGDSFTEGVGIEYPNTFVGILAQHVAKQNIQILNAAVSSYSPIIYYRKIKYLLQYEKLQFDQLVVCIDLSDVLDESQAYLLSTEDRVISRHPQKNPVDKKPTTRKLKDILSDYSMIAGGLRQLARILRNIAKPLKKSLNKQRSMWTLQLNSNAESGLQLAAQHMRKLQNLLKSKQIPLTIVVYPWPDQIMNNDYPSKQTRFWKQWAKHNQANFIDLFPNFVTKQNPQEIIKQYYIAGDVHWNQRGHRLVAEQLMKQLPSLSATNSQTAPLAKP